MKKFRKSPIAIACYVFAAIFAAYFIVTEINTVSTIYQYYAPYEMTPGVGETLGYMLQQGMQPLTYAILVCMAGIILEAVRKLDPANWATEEEIAEAKEARKAAREAKQIAKGEAASAAADMGDSDEGIKAEFAATVADESENTVVFEDEEEAAEEVSEEAETVSDDADADADEEQTEEFSDEFSAVVEPEEVDEEMAAELKKAVEEAEAK